MKLLCSVIVLFSVFQIFAGESLPFFSCREVDLGVFNGDSLQTARFSMRNIGTDTLIIYRVYTGCRCTQSHVDSKIIAPNDSTTLTVKYNGKGNTPGRIRQTITLRTNASKPYHTVHIIGEILRPIKK